MTTPPPSICAKCQRPLRSHFKIERIHENGSTTVSASLCSLPCVIQWSYSYATTIGMLGTMKVKSTITSILDALRSVDGR